MRLPHQISTSHLFQFDDTDELIQSLGSHVDESEIDDIRRLSKQSIPPAISAKVLAALIGINPGIIWSFANRTNRHYRRFSLEKGKKKRPIAAPKVGIKVIQTWLAHHWQRLYSAPDHVHGFVPERSHLSAAMAHIGARWILSFDIVNFFPTTPTYRVKQALESLGYSTGSASFLSGMLCLDGGLPQGAPTSPVLSNMCFSDIDSKLAAFANERNLRLTRFADDLSFSSTGEFDPNIITEIKSLFVDYPWELSDAKQRFSAFPKRMVVHGLLVKEDCIRLTKGYRNKIRAYSHVLRRFDLQRSDFRKLNGHTSYARSVDRCNQAK